MSAWAKGRRADGTWRLLAFSAAVGLTFAVAAVTLDHFLFGGVSVDRIRAQAPSAVSGIAMAYAAAVGEEILYRLFGVSLLVWLFAKARLTGAPALALALAMTAFAFAMGHLPTDGAAITATEITRTLVLNGGAGLLMGWLFWRRGLEAAVMAHFAAAIALYAILPRML